MSDPTVQISRSYDIDVNRHEYVIKNAEAMVVGGFVGINLSTGLVEFMDDADDLVSLGVLVRQSLGDNEHLTGDGSTYKMVAKSGITLKSVTVTGASAITDIGKPVYCTDGQTLTLTKPATGSPIGFVSNWVSSTTCDVYLYTMSEQLVRSRAGEKFVRHLCHVSTQAMQGTGAIDIFSSTEEEHYTIDSWFAFPTGYDNAAVAGSQILGLAIGSTAVTSAALTLAYTSCDAAADMGTAIAGVAPTAANEVHQGDVLHLNMAASGTGFTADAVAGFDIWIKGTFKAGN